MSYFSEIIDTICKADTGLLLLINGCHSPVSDQIMWAVSDRWIWVPLYLVLAIVLFRKTGFRKGVFAMVLIGALIVAVDQTCASAIRPIVGRMRPTNPDNPVSALIETVNGYRGGRYGFPSCHAANTFALAVFLSLVFRNRYATASLIGWSALVSYSRVYLGVHYPGDILGGYAVGGAFALLYYLPLVWYDRIMPAMHVKPKVAALLTIMVVPEIHAAEAVQPVDSLGGNPYRFRPTQLILPGALIGVGFIGLESHWLISQNRETRDELQEHPHSKLTVDDFTQFAPLAATYGLKLCGVRSRHSYMDMSVIAGTAYLLTSLTVYGIKSMTGIERPDGSSRNSFPSGHTATAFAGAELLRREYSDSSPWIGVAGYAVAAGTGFLRMYNNRHWLTDVLTGAGIGILSAEAAYWLYPLISKAIFPNRNKGIFVAPEIGANRIGVAARVTL